MKQSRNVGLLRCATLLTPTTFYVPFVAIMQNLVVLPIPELSQELDPLSVEKAADGILFELYHEIQSYADQYDLPGETLWKVVVDWMVSDQMGWERTPVAILVPNEDDANKGGCSPQLPSRI